MGKLKNNLNNGNSYQEININGCLLELIIHKDKRLEVSMSSGPAIAMTPFNLI